MLALVSSLSGCFLVHTGADEEPLPGDGGVRPDSATTDVPTVDAGMCREGDGSVVALACPPTAAPGEIVRVVATNQHHGCCSSGESRVNVSNRGTTWSLDAEWTVCDCCDGCRCVGPTEDTVVELGPLSPGRHRVTTDGGAECTIVVEDDARRCEPMDANLVRTQRVVFEGQQLGFSLVQEDVSCGCQPRLQSILDDAFAADLCNCCDECFCIDPPYAVSYLGPPPELPPVTINDFTLPTEFRSVDSCRAVEPTGLRIEAPEAPVTRDGPAIWWAVVSGMQTVCCVEPFGGVIESHDDGPGRGLELLSCVDFDCDCVGSPQPFEAWYPLGELPSGSSHYIYAGRHEVTFDVR